ncbi:MAG: hypothetical protein KW793_01615 [Candidatus Doudnabacteria bacterium]|nr:hypothetical protein [Candidatus Doudnabacteria bacterium]
MHTSSRELRSMILEQVHDLLTQALDENTSNYRRQICALETRLVAYRPRIIARTEEKSYNSELEKMEGEVVQLAGSIDRRIRQFRGWDMAVKPLVRELLDRHKTEIWIGVLIDSYPATVEGKHQPHFNPDWVMGVLEFSASDYRFMRHSHISSE